MVNCQWKPTQSADRNPYQPDIRGLEDKLVKVKMKAGVLLIFNSSLPHGIRPNRSEDKVRIAQYIAKVPAQEHKQAIVDWRIKSWKNRIAPEGIAFPGDPRNWEQTRYITPTLTELGEKLLLKKMVKKKGITSSNLPEKVVFKVPDFILSSKAFFCI